MQQYKPPFSRYLLILFLSYLGGFVIAYFIVLPFRLTWAEYLSKVAFFAIVLTFLALLQYWNGYYTIEVKDGKVSGPTGWWKRLHFPVSLVDGSKSVVMMGWQRWFKAEYIVSADGGKILVHQAFTKEQRESLWQVLKQAQTEVGN